MKNISVYLWVSILSVIISLNSCGKGNMGADASFTITYDDIMKGDLDTLTYDEIVLDISDAPTKKFLMINDSIVVNVKYPKGRNFIDVINVKSNEIIGSYFHVGEGPDEMLFCDVNYDGHKLTATDYVRYRFSQIDSDSLINGKYKPKFTNYPYMAGITSHPLELGDSTILVNPFRYSNKEFNIRQDAPRFLKVKSNQSHIDVYSDYEYYTQNVGQVNMIRNDKTGDIWVLPLGKSVTRSMTQFLITQRT